MSSCTGNRRRVVGATGLLSMVLLYSPTLASATSLNPMLGRWRAPITAGPLGFERLAFTPDFMETPAVGGRVAVRRYEIDGSCARVIIRAGFTYTFDVVGADRICLSRAPTAQASSQRRLSVLGGGNLHRCYERERTAAEVFRSLRGTRF